MYKVPKLELYCGFISEILANAVSHRERAMISGREKGLALKSPHADWFDTAG